MSDAVGEIERVLNGSPSVLAFRALCSALGRAGGPEGLVEACAHGLADWPDETREAPWSWVAGLEDGYVAPGLQLARSLVSQTPHLGLTDPAIPDPGRVPGVTSIDLGSFATEQLTALVASLPRWEQLRALKAWYLTESDTAMVAALAASPALNRLESLDLIDIREDLFHFTPPPFRPPAGRPLRLRHVGLRAPDLTYLLRAGIVQRLRSATVLVCSLDEARELAACPELAQLERLTIGFRCGRNGQHILGEQTVGNVVPEDDAACTAFFADAQLTRLSAFGLQGFPLGRGRHGLGPEGLAAVVASGIVPQLTDLSVKVLPLGDAALIDVLDALDHDRVESITLQNVVLTDRAAEGFTGTYSALRNLDLRHNYLTESGAQHLAHDVDLPALERLDLSGDPGGSPYYGRSEIQPIGDAGAVAWASSHNAINLTELHLAATGLTTESIPELLSIGQLEILDLSYNQLTGWPVVDRLPGRSLNLAACALTDDDLITLTGATAELESLNLAYNTIGTAKALAAWSAVAGLRELDLHDSQLDDHSLTELGTVATSLLELDLQQDVWKLNQRRYDEPLPPAIADPAYFPNLDSVFLGLVDEYHGARHSTGYPTDQAAARPALRTFLTHAEVDEELTTPDTPEARTYRSTHDFRPGLATNRAEREAESRAFARQLRG
ncbi:leucine-rich repeat domain-containing protein [Kribbella sp. NPDC058245]|uniref:leucine-rich repeat domain-containing protein n=1 Tax=Kribbella sp. NPDC058245 TaxID=3346399 RepID=UPI0036EE0742